MKRIIICCDGTWNTPDQTDNSVSTVTNVEKMSQVVTPSGIDAKGNPISQITFYHDGVGSGNDLDKITGGAFGVGISKCLEDCYRFIVNNYEPGDELFFFGFSRGAYTARSLVGLIHNSGLLLKLHIDKFQMAYQLYRDRSQGSTADSPLATTFKNEFCWEEISIHFLGVWDTVGALGIPDFILSKFLASNWNFHDVSLSPIVENGYHAVAIDEKRSDFKPCLWTIPAGANLANFQQLWFAGAHSDVGGGYAETELSDLTFLWMTQKATACGLTVDLSNVVISPSYSGQIHDSRTGVFAIHPPYDRPIDPALLHQSVQQRKALAALAYNPARWPASPAFFA